MTTSAMIKKYSWSIVGVIAFMLVTTSVAYANGALAIDSNQGAKYGFAYNHDTMSSAENLATRKCGEGCTIVLRFNNGCGAYAADQVKTSTVYGWGRGMSRFEAQNRALAECRNRGGNSCMVRVWGCNTN